MVKYQVRICFDERGETLRTFQFDRAESANSFFDKAVKRIRRIGFGVVALYQDDIWKIKSFRIL